MTSSFLNDLDYEAGMRTWVYPWAEKNVIHEMIKGDDGTELSCFYAINPAAEAAITIVHGFGEFFGKYLETAWMFYQAGYSVFFIELRGHAYSQRFIEQSDRVYVKDFQEYLTDVLSFQKQTVLPRSKTLPHYLFAHSMGGCIGSLLLEMHPSLFDKAVLSSPMLSLNYGRFPDWKVKAMSSATKAAGMDVQLAPGAHGWSGIYDFQHSSCLSKVRFDHQFAMRKADEHLRTWGATCAWVRAAEDGMETACEKARSVMVPVLLLQAGKDSMVTSSGQELFARDSLHTQILRFPDSKHEIYNSLDSDRKLYYSSIFSFLGK